MYKISTRLPPRWPSRKPQPRQSDEKPEEADGDICLSLNPASRTLARLAPARLAQATLGRLNRTGAVAMVTFFSACSLPEPRKTVPLSSTLDGRRERERDGCGERGTAHLMHTSSKSVLIYAFFHTLPQFTPFSPPVSRAVPLSFSLSLSRLVNLLPATFFCVRKKAHCGIISSAALRRSNGFFLDEYLLE